MSIKLILQMNALFKLSKYYISNLPHKLCILVLLWNLLNSVGKYSMAFTGSIKPVSFVSKMAAYFPFAVQQEN